MLPKPIQTKTSGICITLTRKIKKQVFEKSFCVYAIENIHFSNHALLKLSVTQKKVHINKNSVANL